MLINNAATASWFMGEEKDLDTAAKRGFLSLTRVLCDDECGDLAGAEAASGSKVLLSKMAKKRQIKNR